MTRHHFPVPFLGGFAAAQQLFASFNVPAPMEGSPGAPRRLVRARPNLDSSVFRNFAVEERFVVANFGPPTASPATGRQLQFGLKLLF